MDFLDIPIFDDDFYKMIFRFGMNAFFLTIVIWFLYHKNNKRKEYLFTYYLISTIVFFLCFTLKKYELDIGMALGLFAIFGIIRYRTDAIPIKEMTYLFVVIGMSVINSLANKKMSYAEVLTANIVVVFTIIIIERLLSLSPTEDQVIEETKDVVYEIMENIKPCNYNLLKESLEDRMGFEINRVEVKNADFFKNTAKLKIYYTQQSHNE